LNLDNSSKAKIKQEALITLGSPVVKAGSFASQVIAAIAAVELPRQSLAGSDRTPGFVNNPTNANLRIATLQTIGLICESVVSFFYGALRPFRLKHVFQKPQVLSLRSNEILTAVIHGARKDEPSPEGQLVAIHALFNSLEFVCDNFE
jgi:importin subunit beta-1